MTLIEKKPDEKLQMLQNFFFLLFFWLYNLSLLPLNTDLQNWKK